MSLQLSRENYREQHMVAGNRLEINEGGGLILVRSTSGAGTSRYLQPSMELQQKS